ncbi:hypothetical protein BST61_g4738 [Cercospora zeina]
MSAPPNTPQPSSPWPPRPKLSFDLSCVVPSGPPNTPQPAQPWPPQPKLNFDMKVRGPMFLIPSPMSPPKAALSGDAVMV